MKVEFICDYLHNSDKVYDKACIRSEDYQLHYKTKKC